MRQASAASLVLRILTPLIGALLGLAVWRAPSQAAQRVFLVRTPDGYGIDDCAAADEACRKLAADSWCAARGGKTITFRTASDITGSIGAAASVRQPSALLVTCSR